MVGQDEDEILRRQIRALPRDGRELVLTEGERGISHADLLPFPEATPVKVEKVGPAEVGCQAFDERIEVTAIQSCTLYPDDPSHIFPISGAIRHNLQDDEIFRGAHAHRFLRYGHHTGPADGGFFKRERAEDQIDAESLLRFHWKHTRFPDERYRIVRKQAKNTAKALDEAGNVSVL